MLCRRCSGSSEEAGFFKLTSLLVRQTPLRRQASATSNHYIGLSVHRYWSTYHIEEWLARISCFGLVNVCSISRVRPPNLPLPFQHHKTLEDIGNKLGKFKKMDLERTDKGIFTFAKICVEVDLSKWLPDHTILKHNNFQWSQILDYENTTFWCHVCFQIGHLHNSCP